MIEVPVDNQLEVGVKARLRVSGCQKFKTALFIHLGNILKTNKYFLLTFPKAQYRKYHH